MRTKEAARFALSASFRKMRKKRGKNSHFPKSFAKCEIRALSVEESGSL